MLLSDLLKIRFYFAPADSAAANGAAVDDPPANEAAETSGPEDDEDDDEDDDGPEAESPDPFEAETPFTPDNAKTEQRSLMDYGLPSDDPVELQRAFLQQQQQAAMAAQYQQRAQMLEQMWLQQQQAQIASRPVEAPAGPKLPWGKAPEFDPHWMQLVERDENGRFVAPNGVAPDLPQKIEAYSRWLADTQRQFFADPITPIQEALTPWVTQQAQQIASQIVQQTMQREMSQRRLADYQNQYASVFYDNAGQLNPAGHFWNQHYQQAVQFGLPDPVSYAHDKLDAELFRVSQTEAGTQQKTPSQTNDGRKLDLLRKGAKRTASRGGAQGRDGRSVAAGNGQNPFDQLRKKWADLPEDITKSFR